MSFTCVLIICNNFLYPDKKNFHRVCCCPVRMSEHLRPLLQNLIYFYWRFPNSYLSKVNTNLMMWYFILSVWCSFVHGYGFPNYGSCYGTYSKVISLILPRN